MKKPSKLVVAAAIGACCISQANANLIVNGSFEVPIHTTGPQVGNYLNIPGWTATGNQLIEIGLGFVYGVTGYAGDNVLELDSNGNSIVSQIVTTPGGDYTLSFLYGLRGAPHSNTFEVWWNNALVSSITPSNTVMSLHTSTVTALASNTLEFRGTGTSDNIGGIIDDVQLNSLNVSDGGSSMLLLGCALSGLAYFRRKQA